VQDLSDQSTQPVGDPLIARLPRVDVLVNNAAVLLGENDDPFSIAGRYRAGAPVPAKFFSHGPA